jgi:hypothetical protein
MSQNNKKPTLPYKKIYTSNDIVYIENAHYFNIIEACEILHAACIDIAS